MAGPACEAKYEEPYDLGNSPFIGYGDSLRDLLHDHHRASRSFCRRVRESRASSLSAGLVRLIATCVSFAVCLPYLLIFPVTGLGMAVGFGLGAIVMILLSREDHIVTTGITIAVVLVVARLSPHEAWQQLFLYLFGTLIGIAVGVCCKWCASYAFSDRRGARTMMGPSYDDELHAHRFEADHRSPQGETGVSGVLKGEGICRRPE